MSAMKRKINLTALFSITLLYICQRPTLWNFYQRLLHFLNGKQSFALSVWKVESSLLVGFLGSFAKLHKHPKPKDFRFTVALFAFRGCPHAERLRAAFWLLGLRGSAHSKPLRDLAGPQCPRGPWQTTEAKAGPLLTILLSGCVRRRASCRGVLGTAGQSVSDALAVLPFRSQHHWVILCAESWHGHRL